MIEWYSPQQIEEERMRRLFAEADRKEASKRAEMKPVERDALKRQKRRMEFKAARAEKKLSESSCNDFPGSL